MFIKTHGDCILQIANFTNVNLYIKLLVGLLWRLKVVFETDLHILNYTASRDENGRSPAKEGWAKRPGEHKHEQSELISSQQIPRSTN